MKKHRINDNEITCIKVAFRVLVKVNTCWWRDVVPFCMPREGACGLWCELMHG